MPEQAPDDLVPFSACVSVAQWENKLMLFLFLSSVLSKINWAKQAHLLPACQPAYGSLSCFLHQ